MCPDNAEGPQYFVILIRNATLPDGRIGLKGARIAAIDSGIIAEVAGLNSAFGHDCIIDHWYSIGQGDLLEVGRMVIHVAQIAGIGEKRAIFDALTVNPARAMGLEGYGLAGGRNADLVLLHARTPTEALRLKPARLAVIRRGRVIARTAPKVGRLFVDGRPERWTA